MFLSNIGLQFLIKSKLQKICISTSCLLIDKNQFDEFGFYCDHDERKRCFGVEMNDFLNLSTRRNVLFNRIIDINN